LACAVTAAAFAQDRVTLNFVNAEIEAVARAIGHFTGRTFVVDPRVKGTISLVSEKPMSKAQALAALTAALRLQGFAIVDAGGVSRVVPEAEAKFHGSRVETSQIPANAPGDQILTVVFRLKYESVANVLPVIRPLVPPNNPVTAYPPNNALIVTDFADNLRRIEKVIASIDKSPESDTEVIPLKNAIASDLAAVISRLVEQSGASADPMRKATVLADPLTNSLVVRAGGRGGLDMVRNLVEKLDQATPVGQGIYVVPLRNMEAAELAKTLSSVRITDPASPGQAAGTPAAALQTQLGQQNQSATTPTIVADPPSNSLVITASEGAYRQLRGVLDQLDVRRAQVFIEALIVEVTSDQAAEFGIQWLTGLDNINNGTTIAGGTNFGGPTQNIVSGAQNLGILGRGLNIGVIRGQVTLPGLGTVTNLNLLARALESTTNANILATPNIFTLDNEPAQLHVGQNIPIITGQFVPQAGGATVTPFQTIERRDIGLTLKVKPQIAEGGINLTIYQEVSSIAPALTTSAGIITNKRALETRVLVEDGNIVVLGGLVQDQLENAVEKVPILGDVPVLGHLFRYETRSNKKTNLMLFLRPHAVRDEAGSRGLTVDRYNYIRAQQQLTQPAPHPILPSMKGPVMEGLHMGQQPRATEPANSPGTAPKPQ
jgi:general secretion pathway protein D